MRADEIVIMSGLVSLSSSFLKRDPSRLLFLLWIKTCGHSFPSSICAPVPVLVDEVPDVGEEIMAYHAQTSRADSYLALLDGSRHAKTLAKDV